MGQDKRMQESKQDDQIPSNSNRNSISKSKVQGPSEMRIESALRAREASDEVVHLMAKCLSNHVSSGWCSWLSRLAPGNGAIRQLGNGWYT